MRRLIWLGWLLGAGCGGVEAPPVPVGPGHQPALVVAAAFDREPLTRTGNALRITVKDSKQVAVPAAKVTVTVVMAAHGHAALSPAVRELDSGEYVAEPVNFTMAGSWVVTAEVLKAADEASLALTVDSP